MCDIQSGHVSYLIGQDMSDDVPLIIGFGPDNKRPTAIIHTNIFSQVKS